MFERVTETVIKHTDSPWRGAKVTRNVERRLEALAEEFQDSKVLGENTTVTASQAFRMASVAFEFHAYRARILPSGKEYGSLTCNLPGHNK